MNFKEIFTKLCLNFYINYNSLFINSKLKNKIIILIKLSNTDNINKKLH